MAWKIRFYSLESILVARGKQRFIINLKGEVLHDDSLGNATVGR